MVPGSSHHVAMVDPAPVQKATSLSIDERLELIAKVWDRIAPDPHCVAERRAVIEERAAGAETNPLEIRSWEDLRASLRVRHSG